VQNRQYSTIKNQYELTFSSNSVILAASDDANISKQLVISLYLIMQYITS